MQAGLYLGRIEDAAPELTVPSSTNERIIYVCEMHRKETRISVSPATIEFKAGDHLVVTEQGVFLDDFRDARGREQGTCVLIDPLKKALHSAAQTRAHA